jgi:hypothetical protein
MCEMTDKNYECSRCGYITMINTNHFGSCWSFGHYNCCPKCPPWAKYPEFGGHTHWNCLDKPNKKYSQTNKNEE